MVYQKEAGDFLRISCLITKIYVKSRKMFLKDIFLIWICSMQSWITTTYLFFQLLVTLKMSFKKSETTQILIFGPFLLLMNQQNVFQKSCASLLSSLNDTRRMSCKKSEKTDQLILRSSNENKQINKHINKGTNERRRKQIDSQINTTLSLLVSSKKKTFSIYLLSYKLKQVLFLQNIVKFILINLII